MHRLYRADHHDFQVINPGWLKLAFPWFYGYNILRGLWVLTRLGCRDERMEDALAVLLEKQTLEGKWVLESTPYGRMQTNLEKKGQPSKWVTLKALWVLKRYGVRRESPGERSTLGTDSQRRSRGFSRNCPPKGSTPCP